MAKKKKKSQPKSVYELFRFTEQELEKNRRGEVSIGQLWRAFFMTGFSMSFFGFIALGFMGVGLNALQMSESLSGRLLSLLVALISALALLAMIVIAYRTARTAKAEAISGMIDKRIESDPEYRDAYIISIGKHEFTVAQAQYEFLDRRAYTFYRIQHAPQTIISLEP